MTDNPDTFRQGAAALRNARDWAKEKREELTAAANRNASNTEYPGLESSTQSFLSMSSNEPARPESETSADELALDLGIFHSSNHSTPVQARTKAPPKGLSSGRLKKASEVKK